MTKYEDITELSLNEIDQVGGAFFWVALPIIIAAGYTLGKDRAIRDNTRDAQAATS